MKTSRHISRAALIGLALSGNPTATFAAETLPPALQLLIDERAAIVVADSIDRAVDAQDWQLARSHFADKLLADFSTLSGQPAATISADDLIGAWSGNLKGSKTSLHMRTNHQVTIAGDRATVLSNGYAWNRMSGQGDPLWEVWGIYEHRLIRSSGGWKVDGLTFRVTHERGNNWVKTTPGQ